MKIQNQPNFFRPNQPSSPRPEKITPPDQFTYSGDGKAAWAAMGLATGAIGIGAPAALGMGAVKAFMGGHPIAGTALTVASLGVGSVFVPASFLGAAMSTDSGSSAGFYGYLAGAAAGVAGAAVAIF